MATGLVQINFKGNDQLSSTTKGIAGSFGKMGKSLGGVAALAGGAVVAGFGAAAVAVGAFTASAIKGAIQYESAFAGVVKTTDGLADETGKLTQAGEEMRKAFLDLSKIVPISPEALAGIGELGGQLGISQENLIDFTRTIGDLGVTTNLSTEEAASSFAQLANIMGTSQTDIGRMGSSVVSLGNNFATTEADIVNFAQRIAGAGKIAGLTEADVFGIGAAFSSVGVQAEAGGTAVQKVLLGINTSVVEGGDQLATFAATAGFSADEFANLWKQDASQAFNAFVVGLGKQGDSAIGTLKELGLQDQRLIRSFLSLGNAGDLLNRTLENSETAWAENTALSREAALRYGTTESKMQLLKNTFGATTKSIALALLPAFNSLLDGVGGVLDLTPALIPVFENIATVFAEKLPVAIEFVKVAFQSVSEFLQANVLPLFLQLVQFIQTNLPVAIQFLSELWTGTLLPAIQQVVGFIQEFVVPIIMSLINLFTAEASVAAQLFAAAWTNVIQPALAIVWGFIQNTVIPILGELLVWLATNLPGAIDTMATFFQDVLLPAGLAVFEWLGNNFIPALAELFDWLAVVIPPAIQVLAEIWQTILLPALQTIWTFVMESLIPMFATVVEWLANVLGPVVVAQTDVWQNVWLPALRLVWDFIANSLIPLFMAVAEVIEAVLGVVIRAHVGLWQNAVLPVLQQVWGFISSALNPIFKQLAEIMKGPVASAGNTAVKIMAKLEDVISRVKNAISNAIGKLKELARALSNMRLPSALTPGSPTPFELGLLGIASALEKVNSEMKPFDALLNRGSNFQNLPGAGVNGASRTETTVNNNFNLNVNSNSPTEPILQDFQSMRSRIASV